MAVAATLRTHTGMVRRQNEDAAWMDEARGVFAVADGMGGHLAGEVASAMAIDAVREMACCARPGISTLSAAVSCADGTIRRHAQENPACSGMGTTLSLLWHSGERAYIAHVGDSRIYRLRDGEFAQLTRDHSLVEEMVRSGLITEDEARVHPRRNIITRALGTQGNNEPDLFIESAKPGDVFLLCSDGLNGMVEDERMARVIREETLETAADRLIDMALKAGGNDNVTLILYRVEEDAAWNRD